MNFLNLILGIFIGAITGLIGLHINDILPITYYLGFEYIISSTVSWYFFSLIPSILLRVPENTNFIILNKLNKEVLDGNGIKILENAVFNCYLISILSLSVIVPYAFFIQNNHGIVKLILLFIIISFIKTKKHLFILILCAILGTITFNTGKEILFPLLSGLFAMPVYILSEKFKIIKQKPNKKIELKKEIFPSLLISSFFSSFPALSSSVSSIFIKQILKNLNIIYLMIFTEYTYLVLSIIYYEKVRSATSFYLNFFNFSFIQLYAIVIFTSSLSCIFILKFSNNFEIFSKFYKPKLFLMFILFLTYYIYGIFGIFVLISATTVGLLCNFWNIERTILITVLIFPILIFT